MTAKVANLRLSTRFSLLTREITKITGFKNNSNRVPVLWVSLHGFLNNIEKAVLSAIKDRAIELNVTLIFGAIVDNDVGGLEIFRRCQEHLDVFIQLVPFVDESKKIDLKTNKKQIYASSMVTKKNILTRSIKNCDEKYSLYLQQALDTFPNEGDARYTNVYRTSNAIRHINFELGSPALPKSDVICEHGVGDNGNDGQLVATSAVTKLSSMVTVPTLDDRHNRKNRSTSTDHDCYDHSIDDDNDDNDDDNYTDECTTINKISKNNDFVITALDDDGINSWTEENSDNNCTHLGQDDSSGETTDTDVDIEDLCKKKEIQEESDLSDGDNYSFTLDNSNDDRIDKNTRKEAIDDSKAVEEAIALVLNSIGKHTW